MDKYRMVILKGCRNKIPFADLKKGDIFYLIEEDEKGKEVKDGPFTACSDVYIDDKGIRGIKVET